MISLTTLLQKLSFIDDETNQIAENVKSIIAVAVMGNSEITQDDLACKTLNNYIKHVLPEQTPQQDFESACGQDGKGLLYLLPHLNKEDVKYYIGGLESSVKQKIFSILKTTDFFAYLHLKTNKENH